jgi:hypothetical protein
VQGMSSGGLLGKCERSTAEGRLSVAKEEFVRMINIPVLPLRQLEFLYYFYIQIYIEIKIFSQIISFPFACVQLIRNSRKSHRFK